MMRLPTSFLRRSLPCAALLALGLLPSFAQTSSTTAAPASGINSFTFSTAKSGSVEDFVKGESDQEMNARRRRALLKTFDDDGDGKLNAAEKAKLNRWLAQHEAAVIKKYDTDGDGKLSAAERAEMDKRIEAGRRRFVQKFDKDKDGRLNAAETAALRKELAARHAKFLMDADASKVRN